jgi:hypothetical protein
LIACVGGRFRDPGGDDGGGRVSIDMPPGTERLRHELADRLHVQPVISWSSGFINAVTALFDLYIGDQLHERPAPVLQLVKPGEGAKPQL